VSMMTTMSLIFRHPCKDSNGRDTAIWAHCRRNLQPETTPMTTVTKIDLPPESYLWGWVAPADFRDAFSAPLRHPVLTPVDIYLAAGRATPGWVSGLMALRNRAARLAGLKSVGQLGDAIDRPTESYRVGDRLGIFTIFAVGDVELLLGIDDTHLDVRVSILKAEHGGRPAYVVSTAVKVHNRLGTLYMLPVSRIHPRVVKAMMRRAAA
jgi:Protein of unknown function (DUF2867)